jgi:hypothetical protein
MITRTGSRSVCAARRGILAALVRGRFPDGGEAPPRLPAACVEASAIVASISASHILSSWRDLMSKPSVSFR